MPPLAGTGGDTSDVGLVVVAVLAALAWARLREGRLDRLAALRLREPWLLALALAAQVAGALAGGRLHAVGLAASALLVLGFLGRNRRLRGTGLVALGLLTNALVVAANGAMPVSLAAADAAGAQVQAVRDGADPRHLPMGPGTRLRALGDVVPVPLPVRPEVVSPGDLLVAAGLVRLLLRAAGPQGRPRQVGRRLPQPRPPATIPRSGPSRAPGSREPRSRPAHLPQPEHRPSARRRLPRRL